jgi:hypothetical protein
MSFHQFACRLNKIDASTAAHGNREVAGLWPLGYFTLSFSLEKARGAKMALRFPG